MTKSEPQWWMHLNIVRDIHWKCGSLEISLLYAWKDIQQTFQNVYSKLDWPFQHFKEREQPGHLFFLFLSVIYTDYCNHSTQLSIYWAPHNRLMQGNWCNKASLGASQHRGNDTSRLTARTGGFREIVGDTFVTLGRIVAGITSQRGHHMYPCRRRNASVTCAWEINLVSSTQY